MWILTLDGSFTISNKATEPDSLLVEAYDKESLLALGQRLIDAVKGDDEGVYIKSAGKEGIMWRGKFFMFDPEFTVDAYYQWTMEMPVELLMAYMTVAFDTVEYTDYRFAAGAHWQLNYDAEIANAREFTLDQIRDAQYRNWYRSNEPVDVFGRNYLRLVVDNENEEEDDTE